MTITDIHHHSDVSTPTPPVSIDASSWDRSTLDPATVALLSATELDTEHTERLVDAAGRCTASLPREVDAALIDFGNRPRRSGALLLTGVPIGDLPPTPPAPDAPTDKDLWTELALLTVARRLGQPVGFAPEHGGRIVQNIVPTSATADLQMSTSSRSNLMFHTETAFHPHRPRHLLLLCLRGNPEAHTTMASVFDLFDVLAPSDVDAMFQPRFRTSVDASFLAGRSDVLGPARPLVTGTRAEPTFVFDADLTVGVDADADGVLDRVREAIETCQTSVVLTPGDLLVVDNNVAVHGRSPFPAKFDGTDRWLQRTFVVSDLAPSASDRVGRVITTEFGIV